MAGSILTSLDLSRRAALAMASGAVASAGLCPVGAQASGRIARSLKVPLPRVVAVDASGGPIVNMIGVPNALEWATSQVKIVDLIAVNRHDFKIGAIEIDFAQDWAQHHSCYVALVGEDTIVIGPEGRLEALLMESDVLSYATEIGVIAICSEDNKSIPSSAEIVIKTSVNRDRTIPNTNVPEAALNGFYLIDFSPGQNEQCVGPAMYRPDGGVMTHAAAGWGQGVTATLNIAALRKVRDTRLGHSNCLRT